MGKQTMAEDISKLKKLREETGVSYSLCKKALSESGDDVDKAKKLLDTWGVEKSEAKSARATKEGAVFSYVHHDGRIGVLVELLCETDFVAKNEDFKRLGADIAMQIASTNPKDSTALLDADFIKDPAKKIKNLLQEYILKIGENIQIGRFVRFQI